MSQTQSPVKFYPPFEEKINILSHGFGFLLSIVAFGFLLSKSAQLTEFWYQLSYVVYGLSLMVLYAASTIYHSAKHPKKRARLNVFDHSAIYVLIAGSYTPLTLITLHGVVGWTMFAVVWTAAFVGIILKLFFIGKYKILSTSMYVVMGWVIVFAVKSLVAELPEGGLWWLLFGGISYTIGAVLYSVKNLAFNHAIFHLFVLIGSFCHFMTIYFYI